MKKTTHKKTKAPGQVAPVMTLRAILKRVKALGRDLDRFDKRLARFDATVARVYGSKAQGR